MSHARTNTTDPTIMNIATQPLTPQGIILTLRDWCRAATRFSGASHRPMVFLTALFCMLLIATPAQAHREPANCTGSGLGINLFTSIPDVHVGDTLYYSINVFNGIVGSGRVVCDATGITAFIVTPDNVVHPISLVRTTLRQGESDFYPDVVAYVVRAQDILPDGTLNATANDTGTIHQNDTDSTGGGFQEVNTEVNLPCVLITALCVGGVGENGLITISGTITNCGNNTLVGVTVTNSHAGGNFTIVFTENLARGQTANFTTSYTPVNPCGPSTAVLTVRATDEFTATPRTVTSSTSVTCQNTLTPGIRVTKVCPIISVSPGQLLTFSGSVSNTGNVTLTNIVVMNNQPAANTSVFTKPTLAPGEVANFTGSYVAPANCSISDTLTATAASRCGVGVSSTATATCPILTTPAIQVTANCPATTITPGSSFVYSGTVRNTGNITLNNIVVTSDRPAANTTVFTVASLAPGAVASFTSTVTAPANACAVTTTFSGRGTDT
ncbi:MAG: conserved repeat domain protein, partial [Verrucomicrobia bacterium]|nr:conserved repeat domain protein [Verrucomicrobiota bacterium]